MDHDGSSSAIHMGKTSVLFWPISTCLVTPSWVHPDTGHPVPLGIPHCYCRPVCGQGFTDGGLWRNRLVHQAPWSEAKLGSCYCLLWSRSRKKNCWSLIYENLCIHGFHIKVIRVLYSQAMRLVWLTVSGMPRRESQKMSHACPLCVVGSAHHMISSVDVIVHHFNCLYDCKNVNSYELCYSCLKKMKSI